MDVNHAWRWRKGNATPLSVIVPSTKLSHDPAARQTRNGSRHSEILRVEPRPSDRLTIHGAVSRGFEKETLDLLAAPAIPPTRGFFDECLRGEVRFSLGFMKPCPNWPFGRWE